MIEPTEQRSKVVSVTGGGIHPIAAQIAEMTGAEAVDGFKAPPIESEMAVVVVDCGGTARCGVYPRKRIPTVNLTPVGQAGPLAQFITEDIYVSGVKSGNITMADGSEAVTAAGESAELSTAPTDSPAVRPPMRACRRRRPRSALSARSAVAMGRVVGIFFNAGRRTIDQVVRNVLPFMAFVTMLIGLILYTGIGDLLAQPMGPLANNIVGLLIISAICGLPFLSPILGPGAVIAQVIGVADHRPAQIANGTISPAMALPALFAYNTQVGCDFVPVGLARLVRPSRRRSRIGVPAVLDQPPDHGAWFRS